MTDDVYKSNDEVETSSTRSRSSQAASLPHTPDDAGATLPLSPDIHHHTVVRTSPFASPLPSPSSLVFSSSYHGLLGSSDITSDDKNKTPTKAALPPESKSTLAVPNPPSDYEKLLLSLSSRKVLRSMLDE